MKRIFAAIGAAFRFLAPWRSSREVNRTSLDELQHIARRARIYRGVQIAVAAQLGLSRAHISLVCRGRRTSHRVEKALAEAVLRIEAERKAAA